MEGSSSTDDAFTSAHAVLAASENTDASLASLQVDAVLESIGGESHLDGFNLLGVIANPRGMLLTSNFHGRYNGTSPTSPTAAASDTSGSMFSSTYYSIESTISHATEQMEYMNAVLEDWSRQILEDPYYSTEEAQPESMLEELPQELQNLNLACVDDYLASSGNAAASFRNRLANKQADRSLRMSSNDPSSDPSEEIPAVFFQTDFDLTEPDIFRELLLIDGEEGTASFTAAAKELSEDSSSNLGFDENAGSIHEWFLLQPPDAFSAFLDKVELSLLHQVRSKSGAFFEESLRFAQLQEGIQVLMQQVGDLKRSTSHLQHDLLDPMQTVPVADTQRTDLQGLLVILDRANELLRCKSSIGGFLSAQDDATAIEQIQYARALLSGDAMRGQEGVELNRLHALKTVTDQLNQFEHLVTTNLRDELVEIFLDWNSTNSSSVYSLHNGGSPCKSSQQVQQRVREIIGSLEKCNGLPQLRATYSSRLEDLIRMTVRTTVGEFAAESDGSGSVSTTVGATGMSLERFLDCLDMLFESIMTLLNGAAGVNEFCLAEGYRFTENGSEEDVQSSEVNESSTDDSNKALVGPIVPVLASAAELSCKSISELVRLRKEAHSLVSLDEMKKIWDKCMHFAAQAEAIGGHTASNLRSTLLAQAKAFVERKHESNMSALVAALDSERWTQWEVKTERQITISRLCQGRSVIMSPADEEAARDDTEKKPQVDIEGRLYKVVWSCLLLVEMIINNIAAVTYFPTLTSNIVAKVSELLRFFNSRSTQLVLGAGAIHSAARLKSINAKHLSMVTQCLGMVIALIPHIRTALMTHLPAKQHTLLNSLDQIKKDYADHNEKVLNKFVTIIGGIVEHGLAPKIPGTNFDERSRSSNTTGDGPVACCIFFEGVSTNARKMHQVLASLLPPDHLQDVFSRIFAFLDQKIPSLFLTASEQHAQKNGSLTFKFPSSDEGKKQMLLEAEVMTKNLNALPGVYPWEFTIVSVLGKHMLYELYPSASPSSADGPVVNAHEPDPVVNAYEAANNNKEESVAGSTEETPIDTAAEEDPVETVSTDNTSNGVSDISEDTRIVDEHVENGLGTIENGEQHVENDEVENGEQPVEKDEVEFEKKEENHVAVQGENDAPLEEA